MKMKTEKPSPRRPTYLLSYDHAGKILWGEERFTKHLITASEMLDKYPKFKIGEDAESYTYDAFAEENPQLLRKVQDMLERYPGRFGIGACTYGQPLSAFINEESNIRQLIYAIRSNLKYFSCTPTVYAMSEHAMHCQLPQLLIGTGFKGAVMRTHFSMYGYNPSYKSAFGWWVGTDGSRIPTIPTYDGEDRAWGPNGFDNVTKDNNALTRFPHETDYSLLDFREEFKQYQPLLASRYDDANRRYEEQIGQVEADPDFQWVLLEDLMVLYPKPEVEFTPSPNDFKPRMPWGYCGNEIWDGCRKAEIAVLTAERLASLELLLGGTSREQDLDSAWKNLLVAQHHDIQITGRLHESRKFIPASLQVSTHVKNASLGFIASKLHGEGLAQINVFNPLSWKRGQWIEADIALPQGQAENLELTDNSIPVPYDILSLSKHGDGTVDKARIRFKTTLPGLSVSAFSVKPAKELPRGTPGITMDAGKLTIETPDYLVQLADSGGIASITDRKSSNLLAHDGFLTGVVDGMAYTSNGSWTLERNGGVAVARQIGKLGPLPYDWQLMFYNDNPRIDSVLTISCQSQQIGTDYFEHDSKVRFKIFPDITGPAIGVRDLPFTISETPDRWVEGNYWTMLTDNKVGLAFFNSGAMGSARETDGSFSIPFLYSGKYKWGPKHVSGTYTYKFAVYATAEKWRNSDIHRRALEYAYSAEVLTTRPGNCSLGRVFNPVQIRSSNVVLSAMYPQNGKIIARFYEYKGESGIVDMNLSSGPKELQIVDMLGREQGVAQMPLSFSPWQIRSVVVDGISNDLEISNVPTI